MVGAGRSTTTLLGRGVTSSSRKTPRWRSASATEHRFRCPMRALENHDEEGVRSASGLLDSNLLGAFLGRAELRDGHAKPAAQLRTSSAYTLHIDAEEVVLHCTVLDN